MQGQFQLHLTRPASHMAHLGWVTYTLDRYRMQPARRMNVCWDTVAAPRSTVFKTLRDADSFIQFVDGVGDLSEIGPTDYEALFETDVAYIDFKFNVTVEITQAEGPPLEDAGSDTRVTYSVQPISAGKVGSISQLALRSKARNMERQFAQRRNTCCTVASDRAVSGCLYLVSFVDWSEVVTIECLDRTAIPARCRKVS